MFYELVEKIGLEETLRRIPNHEQPDLKRRHVNALFSQVHRELGLPIKHLILDEAQYVKNPIGRTHKAIKALYYARVFLLSGTLLCNKWYDIFGLIDFLPGHPFKTRRQFMKAFARKDASGAYCEPSRSKQNRLVKFLQAIVVSRPATLLKLKGMKKQYCDFELNDDDQAAVVFHTKMLVDSLKKRDDSDIYLGDLSTNGAKTRAMFHAIRAQQYCANPCLIKGRVEAAEDRIRSQGRRLLDQLLTQHSIQETQSQMKALWNFITAAPPQRQDIPNESDVDEQLPGDLEDDPEWLPGAANQADQDDEEEGGAEYETEHALLHPTEHRNAWLARVRTLTDEELCTPKLRANLQLLQHIHDTWPDEKVVIFSKMLKYLDILDEAIKRDPACVRRKVTALRFDGTLDAAERIRIRQSFSNPNSNAPILITAGSGGAGMNLTAGSKIIQCEPWWNGNDEDQSYNRCWRIGQTREVDVWILRGQNSLVDYVLERARDRKMATNVEIIRPLCRMDDQPPAIPRQFRYGVGE
jgi:SNF2 family DNA or RNA helicase